MRLHAPALLLLPLMAAANFPDTSPGSRADEELGRAAVLLLRSRCVECHGPKRTKAGLRLDARAAALAGASWGERGVIEPGEPDASELWRRVASSDPDERMPADGAALPREEVELLRRWIEAGAPWPDELAGASGSRHWAYTPPHRPAPPGLPADLEAWARNPIDRFVAARLAREGLAPAPEADRATLIRRASLDLTGLPPTLDEVLAFEADPAPDAYEAVLERLLASPHYAEHRARHWLDLARYADSQGYEKDDRRTMWRWRDWVIEAFARDLPFDRFTVEQLAGDLLPKPTPDQLLATGFHRNTMVNREGGADPEEFRVAAVVDRVDTTATVWLGSTIGCARCHDHEYDPFSQREYYELFAFFDQTADTGDSDEPTIEAPTPEISAARTRILGELAEVEARIEAWTPEVQAELEAWEAGHVAARIAWTPLRPDETHAEEGSRLAVLDDDSVLALGEPPARDAYVLRAPLAEQGPERVAGLRLEVLTDPSLPDGGPGRPAHRNFVLNELVLELGDASGVRTLALERALADFSQTGEPAWPAADAVDGDPQTGWAIAGGTGTAHQLVCILEEPVVRGPGTWVRVRLDQRYGGGHLIGRLRLAVTGDDLTHVDELAPPDVERALRAPAPRADQDRELVTTWFRGRAPSLAPDRERLAQLRAELPPVPTALVMQRVDEPRQTHLLEKGNFLAPGEPALPGVPAILHDLEARADGPADRLDLARWLVSPENPLTARVAVNRVWARLFGTGLVATENDFGTQSDAPVHPELLDWLAVEFRETWSTKELYRLILGSATYRQSSAVTPELLERDPDDRLLARSPRLRVEAETVRDLSLAASGLLAREVGGPSVFPPQPEGTWAMTYSGDRWESSEGSDRFRRGMYTFWRRTAPYPTYQLFDAPSRELACTRRARTNTPLQALATLNDPAFVECAVALAHLLVEEVALDDRSRVETGFRRCVARAPSQTELELLLDLVAGERRAFRAAPEQALELVSSGADVLPADDGCDPVELATWIVVANVLLNLDETLTRG